MPQAPFSLANRLNNVLPAPPSCLPGFHNIALSAPWTSLQRFMALETLTPDLDFLAPRLWLMATPSSCNISPLHHQRIKGRQILITENPQLHLVWVDDRIFLKPIPPYLLEYAFWTDTMLSEEVPSRIGRKKDLIIRSSLGFLRTYTYLIRHPSDLHMAVEARLVPPHTDFESWMKLSDELSRITDVDVNPRYFFGELRLARLNFWSKIFLRRWNFETIHREYSAYFQRFYGPLLFAFGWFSIVLSAAQVEVSVEQLTASPWNRFWQFSRVISVLTLSVAAAIGIFIISLLIGKPLMELQYAIQHKRPVP